MMNKISLFHRKRMNSLDFQVTIKRAEKALKHLEGALRISFKKKVLRRF